MQLFMSIISSLADSLMARPSGTPDPPSGLERLPFNGAVRFNVPFEPADQEAHRGRAAGALRQRIARLQPPAHLVDAWENTLESNVLWRLGKSERYFDRGIPLFSDGTAALAIFAASGLRIGTGWDAGASAVSITTIACSFFAALDEPALGVLGFFVAGSLSLAVSGFGVFLVLLHVTDLPMLAIVVARPFILIGTQIVGPRFSLVTASTAFNTANFMGVQDAGNGDLLVFLNATVVSEAGLLFAFPWARVAGPFCAELAAPRLVRSGWEAVVRCASTRPIDNQRDLASRMLDRLMRLIPKLATIEEHYQHSISGFRDLRVAFGALDVHRLRLLKQVDMPDAIDRVLDEVRMPFEGCIEHRTRVLAQEGIRLSFDAAIDQATVHHAVTISKAGVASLGRHLSTTLNAPVGSSLSLNPTLSAKRPGGDTSGAKARAFNPLAFV
jgi:hypothetical protein